MTEQNDPPMHVTTVNLGSLADVRAALSSKLATNASPMQFHPEPTDPSKIKDEPYDPGCGRYASDIEFLSMYTEEGQTTAEYVRAEDGTYNPETNHFLCDDCYMRAGMPSSPNGWKCP